MRRPIRTADVCDALGDDVRLVTAPFADFGGRAAFHGRIATVVTVDDNVRFKALLDENGADRVVVVDGGGSRRHALMGGNVALRAHERGWAGLVVNGCVRDTHEIAALDLGVRALGAVPRRPRQDGVGAVGVPVVFGGVVFQPGEWLYADGDGIVVTDRSPEALGLSP